MNISKHLTLAEVTHSEKAIQLGIVNNPTQGQLDNLILIAEKVFEPTREHFNAPIHVSSGYRITNLNLALKGSVTSQHCNGQAFDLDNDGSKVTNAMIFNYIKDNLDFDQLIWEFGTNKNPAWVHVSYVGAGNRKQILRAVKENGKTTYQKY